MTINQLLEKYPYAAEAMREWFMERMMESLKDETVPEDFKEFMRKEAVTNERIVRLVEENPRVFFDAFDVNDLIINIIHTENGFTWDVANAKSVQYYKHRKEAEQAAVERAFAILDDKLNIIISETKNDERQDSGTGGEQVHPA